jgi:hypothetical protein
MPRPELCRVRRCRGLAAGGSLAGAIGGRGIITGSRGTP